MRDSNLSLTRANTNYLGSHDKPPSTRKYHRDSSVGSKLRYNFTKDQLEKRPKFLGTKHNFSDY